MNVSKSPRIGQLVKVLRGRDHDTYGVIVAIENERFVRIADGDKRKFESAKKKNLLHLELLDLYSTEVADSIAETGRVTGGKLRFAITKYIDEKETDVPEKGE